MSCTFSNIRMTGIGSSTRQPILIAGSAALKFVNVVIGGFITGNVTVVSFITALTTGVSFTGCDFGRTPLGAPDANCDYVFDFGSLAHTYIAITGNQLSAAVSYYVNPHATTRTGWQVSGNTPQAVTLPSAAALTFPVVDDGQVILLTGTTTITSVLALRENQTGKLIATNVAPGGITQDVTAPENIQAPTIANFTRYQIYEWAYTGGLFYLS